MSTNEEVKEKNILILSVPDILLMNLSIDNVVIDERIPSILARMISDAGMGISNEAIYDKLTELLNFNGKDDEYTFQYHLDIFLFETDKKIQNALYGKTLHHGESLLMCNLLMLIYS